MIYIGLLIVFIIVLVYYKYKPVQRSNPVMLSTDQPLVSKDIYPLVPTYVAPTTTYTAPTTYLAPVTYYVPSNEPHSMHTNTYNEYSSD